MGKWISTDNGLIPTDDAILAYREHDALRREVERLKTANESWHIRVSQLKSDNEAHEARAEKLDDEMTYVKARCFRAEAALREIEENETRTWLHSVPYEAGGGVMQLRCHKCKEKADIARAALAKDEGR